MALNDLPRPLASVHAAQALRYHDLSLHRTFRHTYLNIHLCPPDPTTLLLHPHFRDLLQLPSLQYTPHPHLFQVELTEVAAHLPMGRIIRKVYDRYLRHAYNLNHCQSRLPPQTHLFAPRTHTALRHLSSSLNTCQCVPHETTCHPCRHHQTLSLLKVCQQPHLHHRTLCPRHVPSCEVLRQEVCPGKTLPMYLAVWRQTRRWSL